MAEIECNANFKQWFNVFLIISEAWQGYDSKAYGVSNHNLKLQCKKFNRTRDIRNFPTQGWGDTAFCTRKRSETYVFSLQMQIKWSKTYHISMCGSLKCSMVIFWFHLGQTTSWDVNINISVFRPGGPRHFQRKFEMQCKFVNFTHQMKI